MDHTAQIREFSKGQGSAVPAPRIAVTEPLFQNWITCASSISVRS